jgi:malonyl-CoA decarboxylase
MLERYGYQSLNAPHGRIEGELLNVSFLQELMTTVAEQSRALLPKALFAPEGEETIGALSQALMSGRGEASGVAIASQLLIQLKRAGVDERRSFLRYLADDLQPDATRVARAAEAYLAAPSEAALSELTRAVESPRREFFRRLNLAPGATAEIVALRRDLLRLPKTEPGMAAVDADLDKLLTNWFNRGFLVLRRIDWQTPAAILEKIIAYEAVHEIKGWDDLRRRLDPIDRRCFAFFHPALVDEPLIFVEVALTHEIPAAIAPVLAGHANAKSAPPTTAVFYSISNCQEGLRGISFGNFLLKQVVEDLLRDLPSLKTFVTLSPAPHFARWLDRTIAAEETWPATLSDRAILKSLRDPRWIESAADGPEKAAELRLAGLAMAAHYYLAAKSSDNRPIDPVARFHLGNGARLERLNWLGDVSEKGLREAHGLMVNYRYDLGDIERNHETYAQDGAVAASRTVRALLRSPPKSKSIAPLPDLLTLPTGSKAKKKPASDPA